MRPSMPRAGCAFAGMQQRESARRVRYRLRILLHVSRPSGRITTASQRSVFNGSSSSSCLVLRRGTLQAGPAYLGAVRERRPGMRGHAAACPLRFGPNHWVRRSAASDATLQFGPNYWSGGAARGWYLKVTVVTGQRGRPLGVRAPARRGNSDGPVSSGGADRVQGGAIARHCDGVNSKLELIRARKIQSSHRPLRERRYG